MTAKQAGAHMDRSESWMSRAESGASRMHLGDLRLLMDLYGVTAPDARAEMEDLARGGRKRGWWSSYRSVLSNDYSAYIGFEQSATRLSIWQSLVVDGLLQTEEYMRALFRASSPSLTAERIDRLVQVRLQRQELLTRIPQPLDLHVILDEAVLRRVIGGDRAVHLRQLDRLIDVARNMPTVRVQVIRFDDASNPGSMPGFTILEFPVGDPEIGYIEGVTSDVYEEGANVERLRDVHDDLRSAALSETSSISLIEDVRTEVARKTKEVR